MIIFKQPANVGVDDNFGRAIDAERQNDSKESQNEAWRTLNNSGHAGQYLLVGVNNPIGQRDNGINKQAKHATKDDKNGGCRRQCNDKLRHVA